MDTAQWPRAMGMVKTNTTTPMEELMVSTNTTTTNNNNNNSTARPMPIAEKRPARPQKEQALNCPRCNSTNTKFCYYNNYSLTQPRYFCKTCRRYWTEGGSLRNVPVGGGSRKNKRSSSSLTNPSSNNTSKKLPPDLNPSPPNPLSSSQNPKFHEGQGQDLNLAYPVHHNMHEYGDHYPNMESSRGCNNNSSSNSSNPSTALELLKNGMHGRGLGPFMPVHMSSVYSSGYGLQDFRPSFPLDGGGGGGAGGDGYGGLQGVQLFPFEDLKHGPSITTTTTTDTFDQNRGQGGSVPPEYWNGMMGGGGSW